jgi:hypothetical protein
LYYYRARYYSPRFQRFITEDPIGFGDGVNLYTYVANSPSLLVDPIGLYVTVTQYGGQPGNPFGHMGIAVNSSWTLGFYGDDSLSMLIGDPVSGHVAPDFGHDVIATIRIETTPEQDRLISGFIVKRIVHPGMYTLGGRNCAAFVREALRAGGLETSRSVFPSRVMEEITQRYGRSPITAR